MISYPARPQYFAHRFIRLMTKSALAMEIGSEGTWLLSIIAMQEDSCRYSKAVSFWNSQLLVLMGMDPKNEAKLRRVREKCVALGWLAYFSGAKGRPAHYYVTIPDAVSTIEDGPCDESEKESDENRAEVRRESDENATRIRQESDKNPTTFIPLPSPNPKEEDSVRVTAHDQQIEDIMQIDQATAARVASEPMVYSWQDWRREHPRIGIARTGEDGDADAWRDLWKTYGRECFDAMYAPVIKQLAPAKKIWFSQAAEWLNQHTQDV